ncbi:hypothetical protein AAE02nite_05140 [Adhaeribacter aerolatus]|uniref:DUF4056 domain-containing protein n=1 Tax=Adhaeribacter aerolatus TaxID=670289 RepID=A0A512AT42_9BACT|nr:DUF4056 domain-containing protein [Adhaeribacter aerolatus]GEO02850.1 hypothetical protein AAE02nite_05140 [Adhaeribacter aerolatus]
MKLLQLFFLSFLSGYFFPLYSKPLDLPSKEIQSPPPRIIRTCCSFGSDLKVAAIPTKKITHISSLDKLGAHKYLGSEKEGNGIIYTKHGGFIDLGHLRDQADWTAYLYNLIRQTQGKETLVQRLGAEGGIRTLNLCVPANLDSTDAILLAGRIAYDLSVWHEIATWFGASSIPLVTERFSSFSVEDAYSNLLGVTLGMEALQSSLPYEEAMTQLIDRMFERLEAVPTEADTYVAMEQVRNIWWTREKKLPSPKIMLQRQLDVYSQVRPLLVPGPDAENPDNYVLTVPENTHTGLALADLYQLVIKPNYKFPLREIFPAQVRRVVTQHDFQLLLEQVAKEWQHAQIQYTMPGWYYRN